MPRWAGTEKHVLDLSCELRRLGHDAQIACQNDSEIKPRAGQLAIPTIPLKMERTHDWKELPKFLTTMRKHFDIVHIHHNKDYIVPAAAARLAGIPAVVMTRHLPHRFSNRLKALVCGEIFYDAIIAVSDAIRRTLIDCGINAKRIRLVRNGIDCAKPQNTDGTRIRSSLNLPTGAFLAVAAGRLEHAKGFHILIRAIDAARKTGMPIYAAIAGEGSQERELQTLRDELNLGEAVKFLGFRKDVLDVVAAADAAVVPSICPEAFPYAVLEAMACSKPVIASRVGGIPEIVNDDAAVLVSPGDAQGLSEALARVAQDRGRSASMGRAAFARVQSFTIPGAAAGVEAVYSELVTRRRA
jgi:glycosyltransferase involved in cell wall biosynthesis